jgi:microsomal dipeptidase-like Zn-dependent dipeptidase
MRGEHMVCDLHSHYPMHLVPGFEHAAYELVTSRRARARLLDRARAGLVGIAGRVGNYESFSSGPRVTVPKLREGRVGVALSVLYSPFDEMDLALRYGSPPLERYFHTLMRQLESVEADVADSHAGQATVARTPAELDAAIASGTIALVHCVEGAFHVGATPAAMEEGVERLAARGMAYLTIAHLFWRSVATNAPAIPFLPDPVYRLLFPQPDVGLAELGRAAVRACVRERVLVDVSHMTAEALRDTLSLLDQLDPAGEVPLIASHVGYRFGRQEYNLTAEDIAAIAGRGGVVGVILSEHQAADGLRHRRTKTFEQSFEIICRHLDRIREIAGSHEHSAIGSDLDGFIKPTLAGLSDESCMARLEDALAQRYGAEDAARITSGNVLRLLRGYWRGAT